MTGHDIVAAARSLLDTPFRHQGRLPGVALDCAGLVIAVARQLGLRHADQAGYGRIPANGLLEAALEAQPGLHRVALADRQPGDVLLMFFSREPQHLAIDAGDTIIHSYCDVGKVVEHRLDASWESRIVRVYRFDEVSA